MAYQVRKTIPAPYDPFFTSDEYGGKSYCVQGNEPRYDGDCTKNCSGYAHSRYNEVIYQLTGKYRDYHLNVDAKYILERGKSKYGLPVYDHPVVGGILVWDDGGQYGHCAVYEDESDKNNGHISHSELNGERFEYLPINSDNNWAHPKDWYYNNGYKFIGCLGLPLDVQKLLDEQLHPTPKPIEPNEEEEKEEVELDVYDKVIDIWDKAESEEEALFKESMQVAEIIWNALPESARNEHLSNPKYYELIQTAIENIYLK